MTIKKPNEIIIKENYAEMIIKSPKYGIKKTIFDLEDVEKIKKLDYCWFLRYDNYNFYVCAFDSKVVNNRKQISLHRILTDCPSNRVVDHINHNTLDNRKENLKVCTQLQNVRNQDRLRKDNKSGYRYIYWHKRDNKWIVQILHKEVFRTKNFDDAINFRDKWLKENGEYLCLK
jgi:hypothetical protein